MGLGPEWLGWALKASGLVRCLHTLMLFCSHPELTAPPARGGERSTDLPVVGGVWTLGWRETALFPCLKRKEVLRKAFLWGFIIEVEGRPLNLFGHCWSFGNKMTFDCRFSCLGWNVACDDVSESYDAFPIYIFFELFIVSRSVCAN